MAFRHEAYRVDGGLKPMADGSVRIPAKLTKPGVFTYIAADGSKVREYRPPAEVAKADGYADAHVTIGHPPRGVTPDSYARLNVGHVSASTIKADASGVDATVVLRRKDAIDGALGGQLHDLSCGYAVELENSPGVTPEGEAYDRIQRNIVMNHVALLPRGDGRMGTDCGLRLDGAGEQIVSDKDFGAPAVIAPPAAPAEDQARIAGLKAKYGDSMKTKIRKDGKEFEVEAGSTEHIEYLERSVKDSKDRADALDGRLAAFDAAAAQGRREALVAQALALGVASVRKDGNAEVALSEREIKVAVVQKRVDSAFDGKNTDGSEVSAAYLDGMFKAACARTDGAQRPAPSIAAGLNGGAERTDAADPTAALDKLVTDADDAWRIK